MVAFWGLVRDPLFETCDFDECFVNTLMYK